VTHKKTNLTRAAKYIKKRSVIESQGEGESQHKLFQEVNILMGLDHPNIVRVYHLYEENKSYVVVTEYCSGGELFQRIQSNTSFSEKVAA
jgi:calcium-dependent protein kinase